MAFAWAAAALTEVSNWMGTIGGWKGVAAVGRFVRSFMGAPTEEVGVAELALALLARALSDAAVVVGGERVDLGLRLAEARPAVGREAFQGGAGLVLHEGF